MKYATRMVMIPEDLYLKLLSSSKNNQEFFEDKQNIDDTKDKKLNTNVEDIPLKITKEMLNHYKKTQNNNDDDERNLMYNHEFKKFKKFINDKEERPIKVMFNDNKRPDLFFKNDKNLGDNYSKKSESNTSYTSNASSDDVSSVFSLSDANNIDANDLKIENIIKIIKNDPDIAGINENLEILNPKNKSKPVKDSNLEDILRYHFYNSPSKSFYKTPPGYKTFINKKNTNEQLDKLLEQEDLPQTQKGKGTKITKIKNKVISKKFKPTLW